MNNNDYFRAPLPSRATRNAPKRSRVANRSILVARLPAHDRPIKIVAHSRLELGCAHSLLARRDTYDLVDQPPAIRFRRPDGRWSTHTYDYWHHGADGTTTAIIVKPFAKTVKPGFRELCEAIKAATPLSFADRVVLVTERKLPRESVWNAARFHDYQRCADPALDCEVLDIFRRVGHAVTISELQAQCSLAGRLYQAAIRLIFRGQLMCLDPGRILPSSRVEFVGAGS
ncbi:hypothetical protein [Celeribacter sp. ULVN23_4]